MCSELYRPGSAAGNVIAVLRVGRPACQVRIEQENLPVVPFYTLTVDPGILGKVLEDHRRVVMITGQDPDLGRVVLDRRVQPFVGRIRFVMNQVAGQQ